MKGCLDKREDICGNMGLFDVNKMKDCEERERLEKERREEMGRVIQEKGRGYEGTSFCMSCLCSVHVSVYSVMKMWNE